MEWQQYFMGFAEHAAAKSKDPSTRVGCVIVGPDGEIRSTGYNGIPRGVRDSAERLERPAKYLWVSHAEENAVAHAARVGVSLKGCTAYVTHHPCSRCARTLIQSGVAAVVVGPSVTMMPAVEFETAREMFAEAGVKVEQALGLRTGRVDGAEDHPVD
jgi:dCMP deaminase